MCWDAVVQEQGQSLTCTVSMLIELEAAPSDSLSKPWRGHARPFTGSARLGVRPYKLHPTYDRWVGSLMCVVACRTG